MRWCSKLPNGLGRPVKWAGDRTEHFLTDAQGRDNVVTAEMAMDANGRFLGMRVNLVANLGAYISQYGPFIPYVGATMSTGVYDIQALHVSITGVYTNTAPVDAYRGAGRPEAAFLLEKLVDACARDLGIGREEIRRRNFIRPEQFPYRTQTGRLYDVGEFEGHMDLAIERAGWKTFEERLRKSNADGKIRGIGMATYVEACAFQGSEPAHAGSIRRTVTLDDRHTVERAGACDRLCTVRRRKARHRCVSPCMCIKAIPTGWLVAAELGGRGQSRLGAFQLPAPARTLRRRYAKSRPMKWRRRLSISSLSMRQRALSAPTGRWAFRVAKAAKQPGDLKGFGEFVQDEATYPNGTHICEVEIDPETGKPSSSPIRSLTISESR